ncbi:O-antigen ligase family protein [Spirosoma aerophilum]
MNGRATFLDNHLTLSRLLNVAALLVSGLGLGFAISKAGLPIAIAAIVLPPMIYFLTVCFKDPKVGLITSFYIGFFLGGISRWSPVAIPFGLSVDCLLTISLLSILFTASKRDFSQLHNPVTYGVVLWLFFTILQLANPESRSAEAWFYSARGFSFYMIQVLIVGLVTINRMSDLERIVRIWSGSSFILAIWSFEQQYIGLLGPEKVWMDTVGYVTHMLQGQLRSFSFCSDAGQFGAVMAHITLFTLIRAIQEPKLSRKVVLGIATLVYFWGFAVSGSRGPVMVLGLGFIVYLLIKGNITFLAIGGVCLVAAYGVLKFTKIGQSNYQVQRMRSSLDPNDPSLQVRLNNQRTFRAIMQNKPFGVGIGMTVGSSKYGMTGPLAELGIDSWYVRIWLETGVIGLCIHLYPLIMMIILGYLRIKKLKNARLKTLMEGLLCGFVGIVGASYGNQLLGQFPTNLVMYLTMVLLLISPVLDKDITDTEEAERAKQAANEPASRKLAIS